MDKLNQAIAAGLLALAGMATMATPASAAVIGQPGCITESKMKSVPTFWGFQKKVSVCDYRTTLGVVIKDYRTGEAAVFNNLQEGWL